MTPASHNPDTREKLPICERLRDYMVREKPLRNEAADTIEALATALTNLRGLFVHALETPGYGNDANSREELAAHFDETDAALSRARNEQVTK
jgi:hypothetical protein